MPSTTTSMVFFYTYVLESLANGQRYIGFTNNLRRRVEEHRRGLNFSTSFRLPIKVIYYEAGLTQSDARRREGYLKTTGGRRFLAKRLRDYRLSSGISKL